MNRRLRFLIDLIQPAREAFFLLGGAAAGTIYAIELLEKEYALQSEQEIEEAKIYYSKYYKTGEFATPEEIAAKYDFTPDPDLAAKADAAVQAHQSYATGTNDGILVREVPLTASTERTIEDKMAETREILAEGEREIRKNVFRNNEIAGEEVWNQEVEDQRRLEETKYVITRDEYRENGTDFEMADLTYYEGDGVLSDGKDSPISDIDTIVGEDNLKFGYGSMDQNVVYIRNEDLSVDFEVARSMGKYSVEVLHFDDSDELKHSDRKLGRRYRRGDDG